MLIYLQMLETPEEKSLIEQIYPALYLVSFFFETTTVFTTARG